MIVEKNITTNKTTDSFQWRGGKSYIFVQGDFDGATVQLNAGQDDLPKLALSGGAYTIPSYVEVKLPAGAQLDFTISGGAETTQDISISILNPVTRL